MSLVEENVRSAGGERRPTLARFLSYHPPPVTRPTSSSEKIALLKIQKKRDCFDYPGAFGLQRQIILTFIKLIMMQISVERDPASPP